MASYDLKTFLSTPNETDNRLRIYDKYLNLRHSIEPSIAYFAKNANTAVIKIDNDVEILLDFSTSVECNSALIKLNEAKQYLISLLPSPESLNTKSEVFSSANLNMTASLTTMDGDLACSNGIIDKPLKYSYVKVLVNGVEVSVGGKVYPYDCYFSPNGYDLRIKGDERVADKLYWNGSVSGYQLDSGDVIDFVYLTQIMY